MWLWPEVGNVETIVEVRTIVVHPGDREHHIHAKLEHFKIRSPHDADDTASCVFLERFTECDLRELP